ncbi:FAD-binding protein [Albimonas pacifica]|uniref:Glycolate oxidase FAD binding subunit n=1 Tax=Albimonas pacifica TaxID=1114924 RepID=A0A1I3MH32_9RHOB|nr:FAD-binding protein [Albimonas pacifica]SFI96318.1 glycolate oxidase FAD binding subunit [Albimonas pacifica]
MIEPRSEAEMAEAVAGLSAPVEVRGGGSRGALGRPVQAAETLSTGGLRGISLYEPGALTLVAGAGTPLREIEATLAAENQRLAFEPMDHRPLLGSGGEPTIGGVAACNVSGPRRVQAGACRDAMLGVRFVDGAGRVVKNGGRVMKNVTGYDLVKLMGGAYGTLGVLTELAFKVLPMPEAAATLVVRGLDDVSAVAAMTAALGSPFDVSGAAHLPDAGDPAAARTLVRIEGFQASVAYRAGRLRDLLTAQSRGEVEILSEAADLWADVRDVRGFADRPGAVWRISARPSDGPGLAASVPHLAARYDWGGGLLWLLTEESDAAAAAVRAAAARLRAHATLVRGPAALRASAGAFQPEAPALAAISAGLRAKFDPRGLLNPGRMSA